MRNPERLKDFLSILYEFNDNLLTIDIINLIVKKLIIKGLYRPIKVSKSIKDKWLQGLDLKTSEANKVFTDNPQQHKEAGFDRGWPSRFDTWFKIAKELGFVYYWPDEKIKFSRSGIMLLDKDHPENEQLVFANAFSKYQRHNPFRRVLNKNVPLILLLKTIILLNEDKEYNNTGISKKELPLLICWRNDDANELYKLIKLIRKKYRYNPSNEIILEYCYSFLDDTQRDDDSIINDYPDDFIRKMRLTGLISVRGGGRFIDINKKESYAVQYILDHYSKYPPFSSEKEYYEYQGLIDDDLITKLTFYKTAIKPSNSELYKWSLHFDWSTIKEELLNLAKNKKTSDEILKIIEAPLRLEFLTALALFIHVPNIAISPNYTSDDEGLPIGFASGGMPDIECIENDKPVLIEVTLLTGTQQHIRESFSIQRHLEVFTSQDKEAYVIFISPQVFIDTCRYARFIKHNDNLEIRILNIDLFIYQVEHNTTLKNIAFTASSCN